MLHELAVSALGVIDRAELSLRDGCNALTGETGAGKTLVVAALSLLLGGRADRALVRAGAGEAHVDARFLVPPDHPAAMRLVEAGLADPPGDDEVEIVVARTVSADGGSKARINGRMATIGLLGEIGSSLVAIAGQHEHHRIGSAGFARALLDSFAGAQGLADRVADAARRAAAATRAADELADQARSRSREVDVLTYEIDEISAAGVSVGEEEALAAQASRLEHAERMASATAAAAGELAADGGAGDRLAAAERSLSALAGVDPGLDALTERITAAVYEVGDIAAELRARVVEPDPDQLACVRERLGLIARLKRKYGDDEAAVLDYLASARARVEELRGTDDRLGELRRESEQLARQAAELAAELRASRREAAVRLSAEMTQLLGQLALPGARFEVALEDRDLYEGGTEDVSFRVSANPGEPPRPLAKVASGGELSRLALALHLLTSSEAASTMVFDEVDAGVGGKAAQAVGRCLADLAESGVQVLLVTHLPQVAAFADSHFVVTKSDGESAASSRVAEVDGADRVQELSRMLAGLPESERAQEHARELLEMASRVGA